MTEPYYREGPVTIYQGDCIEIMRELPDQSIHAVVTDPPYGLEFMGREWDGPAEFRRVILGQISDGDRSKGPLPSGPGSNSRGYADHDAHAFQKWCEVWATEALRILKPGGHMLAFGGTRTWHRLAVAVEDAGFEIRDSIAWLYGQGFPKTPHVLKPAFEPIVVGRKALVGTVAANVEAHGTGTLNVEAARTARASDDRTGYGRDRELPHANTTASLGKFQKVTPYEPHQAGRRPANVVLDESQAVALDEQSGIQRDGVAVNRNRTRESEERGWIGPTLYKAGQPDAGYGGSGGASRFFYTAKADSSERPEVDGVQHPTVKPLTLMQWLVRLATPPGGIVLEPFAGSGTTVEACMREGFDCIAIEREPSYLPLIMQRVRKPHEQALFA